MIAVRQDPFPFEAVRDLLGILRAMYAASRAGGAAPRSVAAIRGIGQELRAAVDLALESEPGTLGHAAAWQRAERATERLADLVDCTTPLEPTLAAAGDRIRSLATRARREDARRKRRSRG